MAITSGNNTITVSTRNRVMVFNKPTTSVLRKNGLVTLYQKSYNGGLTKKYDWDLEAAIADGYATLDLLLDYLTEQLDDTGGVGVSAWGSITGTLSDQTDLQTALDNKENTITAGTTGQYWRGDKSWQTLDKATVGLGSVENTALSTWAGTTNLTTLGTIATGVWNGTIIGSTKGGTGLSSYTTGDLPYASASNILSKLGIGSTGQVLTVAGGVPTWATPSGGGGVTAMTAIGATPNANGATISGVNLTLQPANVLYGGVVTPSAQTFAGLKTFSNSIAVGYTGSLTFSDSTLGVYGQAGGALELKGSSNQGGGVDLYNFKIGGTRVVNNLGNISHTFASPTISRQNIIFGGDFTNVFRSVGTTNAVIERNSGQLLFSVNSGESGGYAAFTPSNILVLDASKYIKMSPITATAASAITPGEAMIVFVSDTNGTFTSIGFWGYQNGSWQKM